MNSKYDKNFTDGGYRMQYQKPVNIPYLKKQVFQFKIELSEIAPTIWRRILVPSDYNFWDLHVAIQDSMGWKDSHLHHFEIKGKGQRTPVHIGIPDFDRNEEPQEVFPGWEIPVFVYFNDLGKEAKYLYDYGDDWMHTVKLEGYLYKEKETSYPVCIGGEKACPPEDCGGIHGYKNVLTVLADPENEDYDSMRHWVGKDWNPDWFYKDLVEFDNPYKRWKVAFLER